MNTQELIILVQEQIIRGYQDLESESHTIMERFEMETYIKALKQIKEWLDEVDL